MAHAGASTFVKSGRQVFTTNDARRATLAPWLEDYNNHGRFLGRPWPGFTILYLSALGSALRIRGSANVLWGNVSFLWRRDFVDGDIKALRACKYDLKRQNYAIDCTANPRIH